MSNLERAGYLAHTMTGGYQYRLNDAASIVTQALEMARAPYVSFSGGKDSAVLLDIVAVQKPDIEARMLTSGETRHLHANFDEILDWWCARYPAMQLTEINIDRVWSTERSFYTQRKAGRGDIVNFLADTDFDLVFLGLRDEESNNRRRANARGVIRQYADSNHSNIAGKWVCTPIAKLTIQDVGAYVTFNEIPLFPAYQHGMSERTTLRLTGDATRQQAFTRLRVDHPSRYRELLKRFPELAWWSD